MGALTRLFGWFDRHPWLFSLGLVVAIASPGFARVESLAADAQRVADRVEEQQHIIEENRVELCIRSRRDTRQAIVDTVHHVAQFFTNDDQVREIAVGLRPVLEERLPDDACDTPLDLDP